MFSPYLISKLNMFHSVPPLHQNAYPSYLSLWIAANCMIPACGIVTAMDLFWSSIFVRSFCLSIWFNYFAANSHYVLNSGTPSRRTFHMVAYPLYLWMLSIGMILAVGSRATRWRLCDAASSILTRDINQAIDLAWLQLFINNFRCVANKSVVMITSMNVVFPGRCAFLYWSICSSHSRYYRVPHCPRISGTHYFVFLLSTCHCEERPSPSMLCLFWIWWCLLPHIERKMIPETRWTRVYKI